MNIRKELDEIRGLIMNGRLDEAELALARLEPADLADKRKRAHYQALTAFQRGHIGMAKELMERALSEFGENLNLLRDLIICQYHLHDMASFRTNMSRMEILLVEKESQLDPRTLFECEMMVGKFLEEEARLAPALLYYERSLDRAKEPELRLRGLIQKARWHALYDPCQELSGYYRELISFPVERVTRDQRVELEHALMIVELRLVGADHAWQRIERLGQDMHVLDRRLLIFDFVEGCLAQDLPLAPAVLRIINDFNDISPYEQFLRKLVQGPLEHTTKIHELASLAAKLSWSSYLRLLCLSANMEVNSTARMELNRKIQLIIRGLDPRSQELWNRRLKQALQSPEIRLDLSVRSRSVTVQGKCVDLSKKKIGLQLLAGLLSKDTMSVDQAIHHLWQTSFSPEYYHRLRMSTHRLNTLIHEVTGLGKIIEVDSQTVRLRPEVKLKCADAGLDLLGH